MMEVLQPKGWPRPKGYSNGLLAEGRVIFIAGQVGWNEDEIVVSDNFTEQVEQALKNIVVILAEAGAGPQNVTRMTWFVTDKQQYLEQAREVGEAYRRVMGRHFPVMSLIEIKGLIEDGAKVEIEATAVLPAVG
ncbi:MAG: RidA family protein [Hyphomicrobiales bacterium]|nr:RidA family protein [Hyphomicrobiales bacterium]